VPPRELFHFEFPEAGGGAPLAPEPVPEAVPEVWAGPSQEEWEQTQQALHYFQQQEAERQQPQAEYPSLDPFADDYAQQQAEFTRQLIRDELAPLQQWQQSQQLEEAYSLALDMIDDNQARDGEFRNKEKGVSFVQAYAATLMPQMSQRYGFGPKAAEAAIEAAAKEYRELEQSVGTSYHEQQMNQLTNLSTARHEPGAAGVGSQQLVTDPGGDEMSVVRKYAGLIGR